MIPELHYATLALEQHDDSGVMESQLRRGRLQRPAGRQRE